MLKVRYRGVRRSVVLSSLARQGFISVLRGLARRSKAKHAKVRHGLSWRGKVRSGRVQHGEVLHGNVRLGTALRGLEWLGLVRSCPARQRKASSGIIMVRSGIA